MKNWVEKNYFYRNEKSVNHGHFTYKTDGRRMCSEDEVGNILSFYQSYTPIAWFQMSFCAWNQCTIKPVYWRVHLSKENIYIWISRTPTHVRKKKQQRSLIFSVLDFLQIHVWSALLRLIFCIILFILYCFKSIKAEQMHTKFAYFKSIFLFQFGTCVCKFLCVCVCFLVLPCVKSHIRDTADL